MGELSGHGGKVVVGGNGEVNAIKSWTLDYVGDPLETTDFSDDGHRTYIIGLDGWSGSFEGNFHEDAMEALGAEATFELYVDDTYHISGAIVITGVHPANSVDGLVTISYDFQGNGALDLDDLVAT